MIKGKWWETILRATDFSSGLNTRRTRSAAPVTRRITTAPRSLLSTTPGKSWVLVPTADSYAIGKAISPFSIFRVPTVPWLWVSTIWATWWANTGETVLGKDYRAFMDLSGKTAITRPSMRHFPRLWRPPFLESIMLGKSSEPTFITVPAVPTLTNMIAKYRFLMTTATSPN